MATLDQFLPWVLPSAVNCPTPLAYQAIKDAAREFCVATNVIQEGSTQAGRSGRASYTIDEPSGTKLNQVLRVTWEGSTLSPVAAGDVKLATALRGSVGDAVVEAGTPRQFYQRTPLDPTIYLWPVPDDKAVNATNGLYIKAAFAPYPAATSLPDELFEYYVTAVAAGALASLLSMPEQPWTNPNMAAINRKTFYASVAKAKRDALVGLALANQRVNGRRF